MHPVYDYLYQLEAGGYPELNYHPGWAIEDPRYLAQNLPLMLGGPAGDPSAVQGPGRGSRGLFSASCPVIAPRDVGMSLLLTSPA